MEKSSFVTLGDLLQAHPDAWLWSQGNEYNQKSESTEQTFQTILSEKRCAFAILPQAPQTEWTQQSFASAIERCKPKFTVDSEEFVSDTGTGTIQLTHHGTGCTVKVYYVKFDNPDRRNIVDTRKRTVQLRHSKRVTVFSFSLKCNNRELKKRRLDKLGKLRFKRPRQSKASQ